MQNFSNKYKLPYLFLLATILCLCFSKCEKKNSKASSNTLAVIENRTIDGQYFTKRYNDFRRKTGSADNGLARRSVLNNLIAEELLILEARKRGYDDDPIGRHELERIKVQELLNAYHQRSISNNVTIKEDELKKLFVNLHTKIKASHLYAPTREQADSLYQLLLQGVRFEKIAKTSFNDPMLRDNGGSLGYFSVDEMDPAFEEAAYSLKIGEISQPVRTNDGYSIIRVDDRKGNPLVTESEFAKHRPKLEVYWKKRKIYKATQRHADSLRNELNIAFNESIIHQLFNFLDQQKDDGLINELEFSTVNINSLENANLLNSKLGNWTVKKFQEFAKLTTQKQRNWIKNEQNLKDYIAGLVVRSFILTEAKKYKLNKTADYKQRVAENFDTSLLDRIEKALFEEFDIPEDTLRHYYDEDPTLFAEPPRVQLQEIVLNGEDNFELIANKIEQGIPFADLARKFSRDRRSAENGGDMGYLTPNDMGKWAKQILSMKVGDWIGPLEINSSYVFLKCIDRIEGKVRTFEQAKYDVEQTVRTLLWDRVRRQKVEQVRVTVTVNSFPEKLIKIRVN